MPKISDLDYVSEIDATSYLLGVKGGSTVRFPASVLQGEAPVVNTTFISQGDTPSSYAGQAGKMAAVNEAEDALEFIDAPTSLPVGGTAGQVLTKNSATDGDAGWAAASGGTTMQIIDLTSATSDYLLGVGETAKITYTSATSVPLHIATQEGLYEFTISGNLSTTVANDNNISVLPNNTTYSAQFTEVGYKISSGNSSAIVLDASTNQFNTAWSNAVSANLSISTKTTAKTLQGTVLNKRVNGTTEHFTISSFWNNTSTAWTSLGTITFPFAQSGIIIIKRIA